MIITRNNIKELGVFFDFEVDTKLPKHQKSKEDKNGLDSVVSGGFMGGWGMDSSPDLYDRAFLEKLAFGNGFFNAVLYSILKLVGFKRFLQPKEEKTDTKKVKEFFDHIKEAKKILNIHDVPLIKRYEEEIDAAKDAGQNNLFEKLVDRKELILMESKLVQLGYSSYLEESDLVKFYEKTDSSKNLKLLYIRKFDRIIPKEIVAKKKLVDTQLIFDNYVILTFDPLNMIGGMSKKEVEQSKDPILFGVIKNSKKLYFIADWEDEYCNLKLENVLESLGKDASLLDNQPLTFYDQK